MHRGAGYGRAAQRLHLKSKRPAIRYEGGAPPYKRRRRLGSARGSGFRRHLAPSGSIRSALFDPATAVGALAAEILAVVGGKVVLPARFATAALKRGGM